MAALQIGNMDKAMKLYQHVLRDDPEQKEVKRAYKALKEFNKALKSVDKELHLAYNHKASKAAEAASGLLRGMGLESGGLHALVKLKQCTALSGMKMNDDAIEACDQAIEMKPTNLCEA